MFSDTRFSPVMSEGEYEHPRIDLNGLLLTQPEVAEFLRVTPHTVRRWAREGRIQAVQLGGRTVRYTTASVLAFIAASNDVEPGGQAELDEKGVTAPSHEQ